MSFLAGLYDPIGERLYEADPGRFVSDSAPPRGLSAVYDYETLGESVESFAFLADGSTLSRYLPLLPLKQGISIPSADLGPTALEERSLEDREGVPRSVQVKDEGSQPGGTVWDRAAVVALSMAREWSRSTVLYPGDGPVSRCVDRYASRADFGRYVLRQGTGDPLDATFEGVTGVQWSTTQSHPPSRKVLELAGKYGLFPLVPGWNPYFVEGLKTVAYELAEQSDPLPERLYVTSESRLLVHAVTKGFRELKALDWFETVPEVVQVPAPDGRDPDRSAENEELLEELAPREPRVRRLEPSERDLSSLPDSIPHSLRVGLAGASIDPRRESNDMDVTVLLTGRIPKAERTVNPRTLDLEGPLESLPDDYLGSN